MFADFPRISTLSIYNCPINILFKTNIIVNSAIEFLFLLFHYNKRRKGSSYANILLMWGGFGTSEGGGALK